MFKRKKKEKETPAYDEGAVDASLFTGEEEETPANKEVHTELSFHPDWNLAEEETYVYRFYNNDLPPLKPNQVSISGFDIQENEDKVVVQAFLRNSFSKGINFKPTTIVLQDKQKNAVARKYFDLSEAGTIPGESSRPWSLTFSPKDFINEDRRIPVNDWSLAFEVKSKKHTLDLENTWKQTLATEQIKNLEDVVNQSMPPRPGEINFLGLQADFHNNSLYITLLIRNGNDKEVTLRSLPLKVEDAKKRIIAEGGFKLDELKIKGNTSKPWTFVFPNSMIKHYEIDLSTWKVYPSK